MSEESGRERLIEELDKRGYSGYEICLFLEEFDELGYSEDEVDLFLEECF